MGRDQIQQEFLELIRENSGIIHKVCHLYRHSATDKQDLFQEILAQLWKAFPKFRREAKISTWMYRIGLNTAISDYRKQQRTVSLVKNPLHEAVVLFDTDTAEQKEKLTILHQAVSKLSDIEKAVVMLYLEERSYEEMEAVLGIGQANLRVKMNRIKEKLRKQVSQT
ncbi:MAG TPA: sigma-70 family RNA polymerase sigma factor [Agriterribacter sp.]|nr:sigma-70 family RNA polymerase sigma factor [Agriterribacter sp.]